MQIQAGNVRWWTNCWLQNRVMETRNLNWCNSENSSTTMQISKYLVISYLLIYSRKKKTFICGLKEPFGHQFSHIGPSNNSLPPLFCMMWPSSTPHPFVGVKAMRCAMGAKRFWDLKLALAHKQITVIAIIYSFANEKKERFNWMSCLPIYLEHCRVG